METLTESKLTTDHDEIRRWTEDRGEHPALVRKLVRTGPALRLIFQGYSTGEPMEPIHWVHFLGSSTSISWRYAIRKRPSGEARAIFTTWSIA